MLMATAHPQLPASDPEEPAEAIFFGAIGGEWIEKPVSGLGLCLAVMGFGLQIGAQWL